MEKEWKQDRELIGFLVDVYITNKAKTSIDFPDIIYPPKSYTADQLFDAGWVYKSTTSYTFLAMTYTTCELIRASQKALNFLNTLSSVDKLSCYISCHNRPFRRSFLDKLFGEIQLQELPIFLVHDYDIIRERALIAYKKLKGGNMRKPQLEVTIQVGDFTFETTWKKTPKQFKKSILQYLEIPIETLEAWWGNLTKDQQASLCRNKKVPIPFIESKWDTLNETTKDVAISHRRISQEFLKQNFLSMTLHQQYLSLLEYKLEKSFLLENWRHLTTELKQYALVYQDLREMLTLEELPILLADSDASVRLTAANLFKDKSKKPG